MDGEIVVPFSPESLLSSVGTQLLPHQTLWYSRTVTLAIPRNKRALLHFGAVDQNCTVYCNGKKAGNHEGGYWPFCFDVTELLQSGDNLFTVSVTDASKDVYKRQTLYSCFVSSIVHPPVLKRQISVIRNFFTQF